MNLRLLGVLVLIACSARAQLTAPQQKTLNSYVEYANKSAEEETKVFGRIRTYYENLVQYRAGKYRQPLQFTCPVQLETYYYTTALKSSVGADDATLRAKLQAMRKAAEEIDAACKALDTYHKLEDYKTDDYQKAEEIIRSLPAKLTGYREKRTALYAAVLKVFNKVQVSKSGAYLTAARQMQERMEHEAKLLDSWSFNLQPSTHTGWPVESVKAHILTSQEYIDKKITVTGVQYPASSMIPSFEEGLVSLRQTKRNGVDGYNYEAQKSDEHSNRVYLELINYYNGVLVSFYNTFIGYAQTHEKGLLALSYVPAFEIRTEAKKININTEPFADIPYTSLAVKPQATAIPANTFRGLSNYIEYINACVGQTDHLQRLYANLWGSTHSYRDLTSYKGKGGLTFAHKNFEIPVSYLQKTVSESKAIPETYRKSLNDQAEVLNRILTEMNQLSIALVQETQLKKYENDNLRRLDEIIQRFKVIRDIFHAKKEVLYTDVRTIFESYKTANPSSSWNVSAKALLQLVDADKAELFKANAFYQGDHTQKPDPEKIQSLIRSVISDEFTNMKGIEKLGRNNGNCPYSPYEDIPKDSRKFTDPEFKTSTLSPLSYSHPYHSYVYLFNEVAHSYNKFCELAKEPLLQTIYEPELFILERPAPKPGVQNTSAQTTPARQQEEVPERPVPSQNQPAPAGTAVHTTFRDTVYIERHDTVWLDRNIDLSRNMEGYATNNMVLLIDVSGSMNRADKLPLLKKSIVQLFDMMREEDELSLVVFSGKPKVLLEPVSFKEHDKIEKAIRKLESKGTTDGNAALALAYEVADKNYIRAGNNRIVLATDGEFPVSEQTLALIQRYAKDDIFLTVFNFGGGAGSAKTLQRIATLGRGNYESVTAENIDLKLVREVKSRRKK